MNCARCNACVVAIRLYEEEHLLPAFFYFETLTTILAIVIIALVILAIFFTRTLHFNARLLLICMGVSMMISNIGLLTSAVTYIYSIHFVGHDQKCDWATFTRPRCNTLKTTYSIGGLCTVLSTIFLAIERTVASIMYKTYEKSGRRWLGIGLTLVQLLVCGVFLLPTSQSLDYIYPYCATELFDSAMGRNFNYGLVIVNNVALVVFAVLWFHNYRKMKKMVDEQLRVLSTRYQLKENISTTRLMVPVVFVNTVLVVSCMLVYFFALPNLGPNDVLTAAVLDQISTYAPWAEYQNSLMPLSTLFVAFCLPRMSIHIRRSLLRVSRLERFFTLGDSVVDGEDPAEAQQAYFQRLRGQWESGALS